VLYAVYCNITPLELGLDMCSWLASLLQDVHGLPAVCCPHQIIGAWAAHTWMSLGSPRRVALVELGPGRGTLMADMVRATAGNQEQGGLAAWCCQRGFVATFRASTTSWQGGVVNKHVRKGWQRWYQKGRRAVPEVFYQSHVHPADATQLLLCS
jgi:hypothetical protein